MMTNDFTSLMLANSASASNDQLADAPAAVVSEVASYYMHLFRHLQDQDRATIANGIGRERAVLEQAFATSISNYRTWLGSALQVLERARFQQSRGESVAGLDDFQLMIEEAESIIENSDVEVPSFDPVTFVPTGNPDRESYGE